MSAFDDPTIMNFHIEITMVNGRGNLEMGQDTGGVFRDCLSAFWGHFYQSCSIGEDEKVSVLINSFQERKWTAIARILVKGHLQANYFPIKLCKAFLIEGFFGRSFLDDSILLQSFLAYLSKDEREVVTCALADALTEEQNDDWLDFLDNFGAKSIPQGIEKVTSCLLEMAHKELIQKTRFVMNPWKEIMKPALKANASFDSVSAFLSMLKNLEPNTKQVVKMMNATPSNNAEIDALSYLKRYIRGLQEDNLRKFLRFCTGGDVICTSEILVSFTSLEGAARRVVAHTCGLVLEVLTTYKCFPEFREEMDNILSCNFWDMNYA